MMCIADGTLQELVREAGSSVLMSRLLHFGSQGAIIQID
jgi:hypothetical protein